MTLLEAPSSALWWRPLRRSDRLALLSMVLVPVVLFVVPALLGHPAIDADDLIQNFPLRVLAGRQLATGHLPLLDPLTNAGTPLLGGMNAGAVYPLTTIFAFVPAIAAWVANLVVVYVTAAVGVFALLRWHGLRTWSSLAAGFTYAYSGAMIGQIVHLGVVQGFSFLPWFVLLTLAFSRRLGRLDTDAGTREIGRACVPWVVGFAVLWGMTFLTGEPRAIADVELVTIIVVPSVLLLRTSYWIASWRARVAYVLALAVGFAWGVGLGLVQLLPGWSFINFSERAKVTYGFFGAGSLPVRWTALLLTPDLFGGNGAIHQQGYFANYNLPEVTGYVGVLALMAAAAFATRLTRRGWRGVERDFAIYLVIGVVGLAATWGSFTPVGHLFRALPLFGSTRLQSRNVVLVDLALAVLLGWWLEQVHVGEDARAGLDRRRRWITVAPAVAVVALSVALIARGTAVINWIGITAGSSYLERKLDLINTVHLVIALAAVVAVIVGLRSRRLFTVLVLVLACDLVVFSLFTSTGLIGGPGPREPSRASAVAMLGSTGRFALVDFAGLHTDQFRALGQPNMNVFTDLESVQGYGSLISTIYDNSTGTHPQNMVSACHLATGTFVQLRLSAIAIASQELMTRGGLSKAVPGSCVASGRAPSARRYFGEFLDVRSVALVGPGGSTLSTGELRLRLLNGNGEPTGPTLVARPGVRASFSFARPARGAGFVVTSGRGVAVGDAVVTTSGAGAPSYQLDSNFQRALAQKGWRLHATVGTFAVFRATKLLPEAWLRSPTAGRITSVRDASWGDTWVRVDLRREDTLVRSEAYLPGWRATAVNKVTGSSMQLSVDRDGLIESVAVPKGSWTVHFHYHAPYIELSTATSAVSLALLLGVVGFWWRPRPKRRRAKVLP